MGKKKQLVIDDEEYSTVTQEFEESDIVKVSFSGKKKAKSKKNSNTSFEMLDDEGIEGDMEPKHVSDAMEIKDSSDGNKECEVGAKNSMTKKKKSGRRSAQEEQDLDKILAELGEGPLSLKPEDEKTNAHHDEPESISTDEVKGEGEVVVSVNNKKKKKKTKKKKKEEEEEDKEEKIVEMKRKIPKHVREMQEALARRKEVEERKKREEEERLRKEEEERQRQEELERRAEEAKRRKKEREKEKLLKKRQEGKLLTAKQKEEQRRLEIMRNQFLVSKSKGVSLLAGDGHGIGGTPAKRPIYTSKKSKGRNYAQPNGEVCLKDEHVEEEQTKREIIANAISKEMDVEQEDEHNEEKRVEIVDQREENEDEDDWDAKSWDDADLSLPVTRAFELDDEASELVTNKMTERVENLVIHDRAVKSIEPLKPTKAITTGKSRKEAEMTKEAPTSDTGNKQSEAALRSPICCIMGHVDAGKTKLLDCIRGTNVQEGEAGGITQQIGATYFPAQNIRDRTRELKPDAKLKVPGLLVIDTPGHESFTNLRSRGSGLCDIAILVVDIMHGLEPQTIESLNLLKMRNTEFLVALNKVDRLYGWKTCRNAPIFKALKQQNKDVQNEFNMRLKGIITQFQEQGLNTELYYKNKEMGETFSIVPTSATSGEGIPDLLLLLVQWSQKTMVEKLTFSDEVQCTVLEVKVVEGHGTTIDVVLVNGVLHEGDQIVISGMQGPILTTIRALLTPHPMKELRVKGTFLHHKEIKAAQGVKITAQGLDHAIAGSGLYVVRPNHDLEAIKELAMKDVESVLNRVDKSGEGVWVQASTLGSMEALLEFLKSPTVNIPVSGISIGPVHKKDVMKASIMLEKKKEFATILAFDVKVTPEAKEYADEAGVKIFSADIIYHLFDQFKAYIDSLKVAKKKEGAEEAVFPCVCKIIPGFIFNKKDPIILGVDVLEGIIKVGTPLCVPSQDFIDIGRVSSIENNHKPVDYAKKGQKVALKIEGNTPEEKQKMFGRHFEVDDELVSHISRRSIDILKASYRDDLSMNDWRLVARLKSLFKIL